VLIGLVDSCTSELPELLTKNQDSYAFNPVADVILAKEAGISGGRRAMTDSHGSSQVLYQALVLQLKRLCGLSLFSHR
jgi:hypothetical protein